MKVRWWPNVAADNWSSRVGYGQGLSDSSIRMKSAGSSAALKIFVSSY
jgi:hypothetical protein